MSGRNTTYLFLWLSDGKDKEFVMLKTELPLEEKLKEIAETCRGIKSVTIEWVALKDKKMTSGRIP